MRRLLLEKHRAIVKIILSSHRDRCLEICQYLEGTYVLTYVNILNAIKEVTKRFDTHFLLSFIILSSVHSLKLKRSRTVGFYFLFAQNAPIVALCITP